MRKEGELQNAMLDREMADESDETRSMDGGDEDDEDDEGDDEEGEERRSQGVKRYARLILPHVGLVLLTCLYTLLGASIFYSVERPHELVTKRRQLDAIYAECDKLVQQLAESAEAKGHAATEEDRELWRALAHGHLHNLSDHLFFAFERFFLTSNEVKWNRTTEIWTFSTSIFFAVTTVTTIGYGNPVPVTNTGRLVCILFALFGIPLTLVTVADLGKFLSEHLIWLYGNYVRLRDAIRRRRQRARGEVVDEESHMCAQCRRQGIEPIEEQKIPALLVLTILILYTALGGVLMSWLESWNFFTSFYWSFITMTTVGFGDLMPRRDDAIVLILTYIILGLAITTMCIDLVGVQYIRKIHYFGRKIQDARSALAVVGGKVVLVSELYSNLMQKRARANARHALYIENLYISKHIIPFIPSDIRWIRYIDQREEASGSLSTASSTVDLSSCRFCHSRFSVSHIQPPTTHSTTVPSSSTAR